MFQLAEAMLAVIVTWLLWAIVFIGLGCLVSRGFSRCLKMPFDGRTETSTTIVFWLGWAAAVGCLQLWHLFFPVNALAAWVIGGIGFTSALLHRRSLQTVLTRVAQTNRWTLAAMALTVIVWSSIALGPPLNFDTGLYHMSAVRWNSSHSIVPGLGNLHGRLAFNNSSFLYAAMLDVGPWIRKSHHLSNGLLALSVLLPMIGAVTGVVRERGSVESAADNRRWGESLWLALLLPATILWCYKQTTSYTPDLVAYLLGIVLSSQLLSMLLDLRHEDPSRDPNAIARFRMKALSICFLSAIGVTVKLSFAPMGFAASLIAWGCLFFGTSTADKDEKRRTAHWRLIITGLGVVLLVAIPWMTRGVILSGYIAYPQTIGAVDVSWQIPREAVVAEGNSIRAWARNRNLPADEVLRDARWIGPWLKHQSKSILHVVLPLVLMLIGVTFAWRGRKQHGRHNAVWLVLLPSALSVVAVLATAPDLRFAGASTWILGAGAVTLAITGMNRSSHMLRQTMQTTRIVWLVLMIVVVVKTSRYLNGPGPNRGFHTTPTVELQTFDTQSDDRVIVPQGDERAWDAPLPNTPYPKARLSRRDAVDLGRGFQMR